MKLHFLGTCAGTEPQKDRRHMAFILESNGKLYWFDAGEGCSYTAHNMGIDLLTVERIVISHPHMDHIGGLGNLLWNIRKLSQVKKALPYAQAVHVHMPNMQTWDGIMTVLRNTEGSFRIPFDLQAHPIVDGLIFDDGTVKVTALHNCHIPAVDGMYQSYSFLIECEGKRIVFSGDVKAYEELDPLIGEGCDGLIIETGHFTIDDVYAYTKNKPLGRIFFNHNGREILEHPEESKEKVRKLFADRALVCHDGQTEIL